MVGFIIYLTGCILSFGRTNASLKCVYKNEYKSYALNVHIEFVILVSILSWIAFISGLIIYFKDKEKLFLKFTLK